MMPDLHICTILSDRENIIHDVYYITRGEVYNVKSSYD